MARFGGPLCFAAVLSLFGCRDHDKRVPGSEKPPAKQVAEPVREGGPMFELKGNGGTLTLPNNLEDAKRVFPMPAGAKPMEQSAIDPRVQKHWGWETPTMVFDAVEENGKLIYFDVMDKSLAKYARDEAVKQEIKEFGAPTKQAGNKTARAYVWKRGDCVRLDINLDSKTTPGFLRLVGVATSLQNLGVQVESLDKLVSGFEEPVPMANKPKKK